MARVTKKKTTRKKADTAKTKKKLSTSPEKSQLTESLLTVASQIAREQNARAVFVYSDAVPDNPWELENDLADKVFFVTRTEGQTAKEQEQGHRVIRIPNVPLTRLGQIKLSVLNALSRGMLTEDDTIVCVSGIAGWGTLDTLLVMDIGREFEMFSSSTGKEAVLSDFAPVVLDRVLSIAVSLGTEGREGKPVGTMFVLGDTENVLPLTQQLILNPFHGYPKEKRSILDPNIEETIKELATIDGAFIVSGDGYIEAAGAYIKTGTTTAEELPQGLGTRHHAGAAITDVTDAFAITVSESTGTVVLFRKGRLLTEIHRPRGPQKK